MVDAEPELTKQLGEELRLAVAVRQESDAILDSAILESFVERAEVLLKQRADQLAQEREVRLARQSDARENRLVIALTSVVFGVPASAYLWNGDHTVEGFGLWAGMGLLNAVFAWRQRSD